MEPKRRLPVLKTASPEEEEAANRPPWQWIGFGAVGIFAAWLPLAYVAGLAAARIGLEGGARPVAVGVMAASLAVASMAGGFLVGRWGAHGVGVREAALAGLAAALIAAGLSLGAPGALVGAAVCVIVAVPFAAIGGRLGLRRREPTL
ncbi:MAG TPA: hypothetical protein VGG39_31625 [Polyangiaceae bacterium]